MRTIKRTKQFKHDYKREKFGRHRKILDAELMKIVTLLVSDKQLKEQYHDHQLSGNWRDYRDCHIKPDLILIYRKPDTQTIELTRLGSHSELGL